ncbi:MAG: DNA mismatch repair endonuclease MutL [Candidatus Marinimicrobia bacterium]|nr:DNA mismatch repair endonuclease MutL [Candidatus Neomarinimicrobiota bacterium]
MSQKINLLSEDLCNKIAAGEVVKRPASVVKELIENSIDADANDIHISLEEGGRKVILIADNGNGMNGDDLLLAFERHTTSKIKDFSDLDSIQSMGFRGEALASISGVSRIECISCTENGEGKRIRIDGGKVSDFSPISGSKGSIFTVRSLFYNVPARMKFLKDEQTEYRYCLDIIRRLALVHNNVRFTLKHNGKEIFSLDDNDIKNRISILFTNQQTDKLIPINYDSGELKISGFLGHPENSRTRGAEQHFYVNKRIIIDRKINGTIYSGYSDYLERGQYPFFLLYIELPPSEIDINVHPEKTEIKFRRNFAVTETIKNTVKTHLKDALKQDPDNPDSKELWHYSDDNQKYQESDFYSKNNSLNKPRARSEQMEFGKNSTFTAQTPDMDLFNLDKRIAMLDASLENGKEGERRAKLEPKLWQAHKSYIFTEIASGVLILDQHLAHTRILYDSSIRTLEQKEKGNNGQQLLFPISIELDPMDWSKLLEIIPSLEKLGFGLREFGKNTIIIEAIPLEARSIDEGKLLQNILDDYKTLMMGKNPLLHSIALAFAEKSAIRRGERLSEPEMQSLIDRLFGSENPYYCPKGRSIIINTSLKELSGKFK